MDISIPPYQIEKVMSYNCTDHSAACIDIAQWLQDKLKSYHSSVIVVSEQALNEPYKYDQIMTTNEKFVDITAYYKNCVCFFAEVISGGNRQKTLQKLALDQIHHLHWLKNRRSSITMCSGFYFHFAEDCNDHVTEIQLAWDDFHFSYNARPICLASNDVLARIKTCFELEIKNIDELLEVDCTKFIVPVSRSWCTDNFGPNAYQVQSGESVVILTEEHVFKTPVNLALAQTLRKLLNVRQLLQSPHLFILPIEEITTASVQSYFKFKRCNRPLSRTEARQNMKKFAIKTAAAIKELHAAGFAHLDIRLGNICFVDTSAVLIDLDRCLCNTEEAWRVSAKYGNSNMYKYAEGWTVTQLDWKQYGLMLYSILKNISVKDYHLSMIQMNNTFLAKLYSEG